jgi:hypothetical protein
MSPEFHIDMLVSLVKQGKHEHYRPAERGRFSAILRWLAAEFDPEKKVIPLNGVLNELGRRNSD